MANNKPSAKRPLLIVLSVCALVVLSILFINTLRFKSQQGVALTQQPKEYPVNDSAIKHLADMITIPAITYNEPAKMDSVAFDSLITFLRTTYPLLDSLNPVVINRYSLLYHWKGNNPALQPVIIYGHLDVVPAERLPGTHWKFPAFDGQVSEGSVWGRGSIDDKGSVIAILESVTELLKKNFQPKHDIYFAFGHDEESGGFSGAFEIAKYLEAKKIHAEFLIDEGGFIAEGMVPFVSHPVALIGTGEKGYLTLQLRVKSEGGHSSMPAKETSVDILADAIVKIREHKFPSRATQPLKDFIKYTGPEMRMPYKILFANQWLFRRLIFREYEKLNGGNAMIRTTGVATIFHAGLKDNIVPSEAAATVNFRILQGESTDGVLKRVKEIIDDERITVTPAADKTEPSKISSIQTPGFQLLQKTIHEIFPDVIVSPQLLIGGTDSKHFSGIASSVYRFLPIRVDQEKLDGMHGMNEHIDIKNLMECIAFYEKMLSEL